MTLLTRLFTLTALCGALAFTTPALAMPQASCGDAPVLPNKEVPEGAAEAALTIDGMKCKGCSKKLHSDFLSQEGVYAAEVDYEGKKATIFFDAEAISVEKLIEIVEKRGFQAKAQG